jgi:hypothetical protein
MRGDGVAIASEVVRVRSRGAVGRAHGASPGGQGRVEILHPGILRGQAPGLDLTSDHEL